LIHDILEQDEEKKRNNQDTYSKYSYLPLLGRVAECNV
jgi:hypothetical protein